MGLISLLLLGPVVLAVLLLLLPKTNERLLKTVALGGAWLLFVASLALYFGYDGARGGFQFVEDAPWINARLFESRYSVGVDGISLFLVILTTLLTPISLMASWNSIQDRVRSFLVFMLLLQTGVLGVFVARDMFLFYIFWEFQLIPMYFLIGMWGGANRIYATIKFFLYTLMGSLLMLVAIMWLWKESGYTFDMEALTGMPALPLGLQSWLFGAFALAFSIKVPVFPVHTWLPDAHTEAPTAGSVILAGVLLKMGTYGFIRFCFPLFPDASVRFAPLFIALAVVGILYGAIVSAVQPDMKKLVAYSSVSHLGFVMLGLFSFNQQAWQGALIQMVNHGITTGALFLCVGILYDQRHTRLIREYGGAANMMPTFNVLFLTALLGSVGLPMLNGFIGEFNILLGAFPRWPVWTVFATSGVILAAVYLFWMFQRVMHGPIVHEETRQMKDVSRWQIAYLAPLIFLIVWLGVFPNTFFSKTDQSVRAALTITAEKAPILAATPATPTLYPDASDAPMTDAPMTDAPDQTIPQGGQQQ